MKKLKDFMLGDMVHYNSYEGIKKSGWGKVIDLWKADDGKWCATLEGGGKVVCVSDSDIK
jgi:hypothetical protein